ncbi:MAG TPA: hypothetical protein VHG53_05070 [Candidatus Limnocylindria bacterium]|nr:hypothetical protein [Candidatus Limnocylindria bacterium]
MADLRSGGVTRRARAGWWLGGLAAGAGLGWLFAVLGGLFLGLVVVLPFAAARGRAGAAVGGALTGAGVAAIGVHGLGPDLFTLSAALTLAVGLLLSGVSLTRA